MIWAMFVGRAARGRGVGAAILRAAVDHARAWPGIIQVHLSVTETSEEAARLYRSLGFREWGWSLARSTGMGASWPSITWFWNSRRPDTRYTRCALALTRRLS